MMNSEMEQVWPLGNQTQLVTFCRGQLCPASMIGMATDDKKPKFPSSAVLELMIYHTLLAYDVEYDD